ncbi:MAG: M24 family metallopeptidase, partial [Nevskiaceae bacterium]|nr:M24 family metallopeptidase [Nevskiaceae bacterium]
EPGMVMTVEPGIYIPERSRGVPKRFWNIGIRIEDDVAVVAGGHEILTDDVPREAREIEAVMAGRS